MLSKLDEYSDKYGIFSLGAGISVGFVLMLLMFIKFPITFEIFVSIYFLWAVYQLIKIIKFMVYTRKKSKE